MKTTMAQQDRYSIEVDTVKNRIYDTMTGSWRDPRDFPEYLTD